MKLVLMLIPFIFIAGSAFWTIRSVKNGTKTKKALIIQMVSFLFIFALTIATPIVMSAATTDASTVASADSSLNVGLGLLAAALVTGLSGIGGGRAVAASAPAAIAATSEDPKAFGKALIFVALGEGIALYGLLISVMILNKI